MNTLETFIAFLDDPNANEMYITGVAGTGKTTQLADLIQYCINKQIPAITCAYTHKAVGVLASKLPKTNQYNRICTLHSYLKKIPVINSKATELREVDGNAIVADSELSKVLFIDEFSMIGEKDYCDVNTKQWSMDGRLLTKVVYIGDPNQLPPVKDAQVIVPKGKYQVVLTKIHRQADDNPLIDTLMSINDMINGAKVKPLEGHCNFRRNQDIVKLYKVCKTSKVLLAYTNDRVQDLNAQVQGRSKCKEGDTVFVSTTKELVDVNEICDTAEYIKNIRGDVVQHNDKYKTLETLEKIKCIKFYKVIDSNMFQTTRAVVFGHSTYLKMQDELAKEAVKCNRIIEKQFKIDAKSWSMSNYKHELAKKRAEAWKRYMAYKENVVCIDFPHAMTVHKSQGSTYENVFLDIEDMGKCADHDFELYLKLMYVAISRASETVWTN